MDMVGKLMKMERSILASSALDLKMERARESTWKIKRVKRIKLQRLGSLLMA